MRAVFRSQELKIRVSAVQHGRIAHNRQINVSSHHFGVAFLFNSGDDWGILPVSLASPGEPAHP